MVPSLPTQPLIVVVSPPGAGRTSATLELAREFEAQNRTVLLVQWALRDSISPRLGHPHAVHAQRPLSERLFVMNFSPEDALREYFVEHLHMGFFHRLMLENQAVSDMVRGVPGLGELIFFGRMLWLFEHPEENQGTRFDHVIVDAPSRQWVDSVFGMVRSLDRAELGGPLESEVRRVIGLIDDPTRCLVIHHDDRPPSREEIPESSIHVDAGVGSRGLPRVHLIAGAGGAGRTTLANALARKLARGGAKVSLLSLDPEAPDGGPIERLGEGSITRERFELAKVIHRWIDEENLSREDVASIHENVLFRIARDHIPSIPLSFAPAWIAEIIESDRSITDLVVDLPSGLALAELLRRPERFARFADGRVVGLFRKGSSHGGLGSPLGWLAAQGARGVLAAVGAASGEGVLEAMGELLLKMSPVLERLIARIHAGIALLEGPSAHAILVAPPRASSADDLDALHEVFALHHIRTSAVVQHPKPRNEAEQAWVDRARALCEKHRMPFDAGPSGADHLPR